MSRSLSRGGEADTPLGQEQKDSSECFHAATSGLKSKQWTASSKQIKYPEGISLNHVSQEDMLLFEYI